MKKTHYQKPWTRQDEYNWACHESDMHTEKVSTHTKQKDSSTGWSNVKVTKELWQKYFAKVETPEERRRRLLYGY